MDSVKKENIPKRPMVKKFISTIGAPGEVIEEVCDMSLMRLSSGTYKWFDTSVLTEYPE